MALFDQDTGSSDMVIDDVEFYHTMRERFGCSSAHVLKQVFAELDTDHDGELSVRSCR